jgi:hypothetical protein
MLGNGGSNAAIPSPYDGIAVLFCLTFDGSVAKTYINGVLQGTATAFTDTIGDAAAANAMTLGERRQPDGGGGGSDQGSYFDGTFAFVGLCNGYALTQTNVDDLVTFSNANFGTSF